MYIPSYMVNTFCVLCVLKIDTHQKRGKRKVWKGGTLAAGVRAHELFDEAA